MRPMSTWKPASIVASVSAAAGIVAGATGVWLLPDTETHSDSLSAQPNTSTSVSAPWAVPLSVIPADDLSEPGQHRGATCRTTLAPVADQVLSDEALGAYPGTALKDAHLGALVPVITWSEGRYPMCAVVTVGALRDGSYQLALDPRIVDAAIVKSLPNSR